MTDRTFQLAMGLINAVNNAEYTDNSPVEFGGNPVVQMVISRWEDVKLADKLAIEAAAAADGFSVV